METNEAGCEEPAVIISGLQETNAELVRENAVLKENLESVNADHDILQHENEKLKEEYRALQISSRQKQECLRKEKIVLKKQVLTFENIRHDNHLVKFYTGFPNELAFKAFSDYLSSQAGNLTYWRGNLTPKNAKYISRQCKNLDLQVSFQTKTIYF